MGVVKLADYRPQLEVVEHRVADTEDGFMRVANEITDSLLMADLTVRQLKVMLAIMRKTYGFNKPMDRLTNTQIAAMTGIHHTHVCAAKRQLIERKFLIADGVKIGVNKVVSQWISQDSLTLAKTANKTLAESANGYKPSQLNTKDNIQKTINTNTPLPPTNMVENAMSKDLRNAVAKNLGASDAAKYLKANSDYANVYNKVLNKNIANKLNKASSEASPELINTVVLSRKPSDVKRIWSALDDKGKDAMRAAYVSKIAEKAGDSPAKFITEVNKLKSQSGGEIYNTIFSGKHMKELDALHEVLQQTARSDTANVVTQTGQSQANRIRTIGATATLGVSMGLEAGFGAMMRLYESKAARNALLRLANTKAGTPAYERALSNAANAIRPLLATEATQQ